jgi:hypothetical protein
MGKWHPVGGPLSFRGIAHAMNPGIDLTARAGGVMDSGPACLARIPE